MLQAEGYSDNEAMGPMLAEVSEDDGYVSPEFDLPSEPESEDEQHPPSKKPRRIPEPVLTALEDEEQLALQMLRSRR